MSIGTLSIDGVQVATVESFEFTAAYDDPTQRPCGCGSMPTRIERHDAYACLTCDRWIEKKCRDSKCWFCTTRPEKPGEVAK